MLLECLGAGMCDFAIKPISFKETLRLVKKWAEIE